ncbi:hypothetical protein GCK72_020381 [Caenorhabditis remanei]|uniref:T20D4.11-like domain-containing protein n=1 Tax=Caenorhabditis remanei TaxID=31234 RepID=A0A6A5GGD7_CAERE|nr:hypothetical protein GCK72_020381 [Caenorhabditis remanei]KAF1753824.1 hypothetical protein GCK72_020381 [Caenorhabditis remanei]
MTLIPCCSGYSVNCRSDLVRQEIRKCTKTVHDFQDTQVRVDGNKWLEPNVSKELNAKCDDAMNCLHLLDHCSVFEDDDILWLDDFCDSYGFLTGNFHECAVKIDKNQQDPCVQHYLVNSPYFMLDGSQRCQMLKSDGSCVKSVISSTCSPGSANDFQDLLDRQMIRLKC